MMVDRRVNPHMLLELRRLADDPTLSVERDPFSGYWHVEFNATGHTGPDMPTSTAALRVEIDRFT